MLFRDKNSTSKNKGKKIAFVFCGLFLIFTTILLFSFFEKKYSDFYLENDYIIKNTYPLEAKNPERIAEHTNKIYQDYIKDSAANYFVSVVPDKSYFVAGLNADSKELAEIFISNLENETYIDIFDYFSLNSYYKTDSHWTQESLFDIIKAYEEPMNLNSVSIDDYEKTTLSPFYGAYHDDFLFYNLFDELTYYSNETTDWVKFYNYETESFFPIYDENQFDTSTPYSLFSGGPTPLIKAENPNSDSNRELIIIRDSFASSLAPLFLESYKSITLIDFRYFSASLLDDYVDFKDKDVLVLYSSLILNSNIILK